MRCVPSPRRGGIMPDTRGLGVVLLPDDARFGLELLAHPIADTPCHPLEELDDAHHHIEGKGGKRQVKHVYGFYRDRLLP